MGRWYDDYIRKHGGYNPRDKEEVTLMHLQYMLARTQRLFEYEGLPDTIPARMFELYLQVNGHCAIAPYRGELYAYTGGLGGEPDAYYRPTLYTIANAAQNRSANLTIDKDCIVVRNDSLYIGLLPLFRRYSYALAENELTLHVMDINSRMLALISASDDRTIESAKKYLGDIERGQLGVIAENAFLEGLKAQPLTGAGGRSTMVDFIEYEQYLRAQWYNDIGLDSNYNMKRERLNTAEVEMNNDCLTPLIDDMLACRKEALDKVNNMFDTSISVKLSSAWARNEEEQKAYMETLRAGTDAEEKEGEESV